MSAAPTLQTYQTYRGLPPLAGLATHAEAARPGLSVEACVTRLKRFHYAFLRLHEIFTAAGGTHDDWDTYDRVMREERRTAVLVTPTRTYSNPS